VALANYYYQSEFSGRSAIVVTATLTVSVNNLIAISNNNSINYNSH